MMFIIIHSYYWFYLKGSLKQIWKFVELFAYTSKSMIFPKRFSKADLKIRQFICLHIKK